MFLGTGLGVQITGAKLKPEALDFLQLPVAVREGRIGNLLVRVCHGVSQTCDYVPAGQSLLQHDPKLLCSVPGGSEVASSLRFQMCIFVPSPGLKHSGKRVLHRRGGMLPMLHSSAQQKCKRRQRACLAPALPREALAGPCSPGLAAFC